MLVISAVPDYGGYHQNNERYDENNEACHELWLSVPCLTMVVIGKIMNGAKRYLTIGKKHYYLGKQFKLFQVLVETKKGLAMSPFLRGSERIRTAVGAFAELCLATRPQNLFC